MKDNSSYKDGPEASHAHVFLCYSRKDRASAERLRLHFAGCRPATHLTVWDDSQIPAGSLWQKEIASALEAARFAILLVSADFLASPFITTFEFPRLLEAAESRGTLILPIILGYCTWDVGHLAAFQAVNDPSKPLYCLKPCARDKIWVSVVRHILAHCQSLPPTQQHVPRDDAAFLRFVGHDAEATTLEADHDDSSAPTYH